MQGPAAVKAKIDLSMGFLPDLGRNRPHMQDWDSSKSWRVALFCRAADRPRGCYAANGLKPKWLRTRAGSFKVRAPARLLEERAEATSRLCTSRTATTEVSFGNLPTTQRLTMAHPLPRPWGRRCG